jgi:hypothetical protein
MTNNEALPFPNPEEGIKYMADLSPRQMSVLASKKLINLFFEWKETGKDASGHKYSFKDNIESLSSALTVLEIERILTIQQKNAIIEHLSR